MLTGTPGNETNSDLSVVVCLNFSIIPGILQSFDLANVESITYHNLFLFLRCVIQPYDHLETQTWPTSRNNDAVNSIEQLN